MQNPTLEQSHVFSFDEHNSITICYFWIKMTILLFIEF